MMMVEEPKSKGWWQTVPGILTAIAGIITAMTGLLVALHQIGVFDSRLAVSPTISHKTTENSTNHEKQPKLLLTDREVEEIRSAYNDCRVGLYPRASEKYETVAKRFLSDPQANLQLLEEARKHVASRDQLACKYYEQFFSSFR
jgi:hypothetical protein